MNSTINLSFLRSRSLSPLRLDSDSYVLYYGSHQFSVIPKRVFRSDDQRQAFEQMLTDRISNIVRREKCHGRP